MILNMKLEDVFEEHLCVTIEEAIQNDQQKTIKFLDNQTVL